VLPSEREVNGDEVQDLPTNKSRSHPLFIDLP